MKKLPDAGIKPFVSPSRRTKSLGAVHRRRFYDPIDGKTCHQCRHKTTVFSATCRNKSGNPCSTNYCRACLLNRYGESAEAAVSADAWGCPKCRGICNCSNCMKKKGQRPTGILRPTARFSGFSPVSELQEQRQEAETSGSASNPIDVEELLEEERSREEQRDREIEMLKDEIAMLRAAIDEAESRIDG